MRLISHNLLKSNVNGAENGYPLRIEATKVEEQAAEFDADFIHNMLGKLEWGAFRQAVASLDLGELPDEVTDEWRDNEENLCKVHRLLLEVHVLEGALVCPETGRRFPIKDGIPNMLLHEDEL